MFNVVGKRARRSEWVAQVRLNLAFERGLTTKLRKEFKLTGRSAAAQARDEHHVSIERQHYFRLMNIIRPYMKAIFKTYWHRVRAEFKFHPEVLETKYTEEELDLLTEEYLQEVSAARMGDVSKSTAEKIADQLRQGHADELSWDEIAKNIEAATGGEVGDARARTIARTELHSASQAGSQASAEDLGIPGLQKQWLTVEDDRVRPDHADAEGQAVPLDEPFVVGGEELNYPGDPEGSASNTINCRCVQTYITPGQE